MKAKLLVVFLPILLFTFSCSNPFSNENGEVTAEKIDEELIIRNGMNESIYYAAFEQELLALIDWAPISTEENRISPKKAVQISTDEVTGYKEGAVIVVFYWTIDNEIFENIEVK